MPNSLAYNKAVMRHRNSPKIKLPASSYEERCAARERAANYRIVEHESGICCVYAADTDPDDLAFGRATPLATFRTYDEAVKFTERKPTESTVDFKLRIRQLVTGLKPFHVNGRSAEAL